MGPLEILLILILGFLFFGPEKLPQMAAKAGKLYRNFKKATFDLSKSITDEVDTDEKNLRNDLTEIRNTFSKEFSAGTSGIETKQEVTTENSKEKVNEELPVDQNSPVHKDN